MSFFKTKEIKYFNLYRKFLFKKSTLNSDDTEKFINKIDINSNKVLVKSSLKKNSTILLVGHVQSGKTSNFIGCVAKYFDNGSNFAIILGGVNGTLYSQNHERVIDFFADERDIYISENVRVFDKIDNISEITNALNENKKIIISIIKNHTQINKLASLCDKLKEQIIKPLIVDDEGDQFSFTNWIKFKKNNVHTSTYKAFKTLIESLNEYTFLSVTATPYAHVLSSKYYKDEINFLKPNHVVVITPGKGYMGIHEFFEGNNSNAIVEKINESDDVIYDFIECSSIPDSFKEALAFYFLNGYIFTYEHNYEKNSEMLVNITVKNCDNKKLVSTIQDYVENYFFKNIYKQDTKEHKFLEKAIDEFNNNLEDGDDKLSINEFLSKVKDENLKNKIEYHLVIGKEDYVRSSKIYNIIVGSKKIDRGNTFPHLLVSYVTKRNKNTANIDTLLQMCRWFGYRDLYKKFIKVWLKDDLIKDYRSILQTNSELMEILKDYEDRDYPIEDMKNSLCIEQNGLDGKKLKGTRESVAKQKILFNNFFIYSKTFLETLKYQKINKNVQKIWNLTYEEIKFNGSNFSLKDIHDKIDNYPSALYETPKIFIQKYGESNLRNAFLDIYPYEDDTNRKDILDQIKNINKKVVVSLMTKNSNDTIYNMKTRTRTFDIDDKTFNCIEKGPNDSYFGDKYWYRASDDYIFIQIHKIKPTNVNLSTGCDGYVYKVIISTKEKIVRYIDNVIVEEQ